MATLSTTELGSGLAQISALIATAATQDDGVAAVLEQTLHLTDAWQAVLFTASRIPPVTLERDAAVVQSKGEITDTLSEKDEVEFLSLAYKTLRTRELAQTNGGSDTIGLPLRIRHEIYGVLILDHPIEFSPAQIEIAQVIASQLVGLLVSQESEARVNDANYDKHRYVSTVTHELKIPLTSIRGYTDLLLKGMAGDITDQQRQFLETVTNNVNRMSHLISDLADVARIETGRIRFELEKVELALAISDAINTLQSQLEQNQRSVNVQIPPGVKPILTDRMRLGQVFTNLISNADKYSPVGPAIDITVVPNKDRVAVTVKDYGLGISAEDKAQLFQPFFRSEARDVRAKQGWGLGLHVTRRFVRVMGGDISLESELGVGSAFTVELPYTPPTKILSD